MLIHKFDVTGARSICGDCGYEASLYGCRCARFAQALAREAVKPIPGEGFKLGGVRIPFCPFCRSQLQRICAFDRPSADNPDCMHCAGIISTMVKKDHARLIADPVVRKNAAKWLASRLSEPDGVITLGVVS